MSGLVVWREDGDCEVHGGRHPQHHGQTLLVHVIQPQPVALNAGLHTSKDETDTVLTF